MSKNVIILVTMCIFSTCYSQCDNDKCYRYYKDLIKKDRDSIQSVFGGILEKYGDVDDILRNLLIKLNNTILRTDQNLNNFEKDNDNIEKTNNLSNSALLNLVHEKNITEKDIKNINRSINWSDEIERANKTANLIISILATLDDIKENENEVNKLRDFLEKFDEANYAKDITNIPHSVSDDLELLEKLLNEDHNTNCFDKFHDDLKNLFAQLASILNIDAANDILTNLKERADQTQEKARDILDKTNGILEKEKNLKNIHDLANETLTLAGDIEELKNSIDRLLENNREIFEDKLRELQKAHEKDLQELYKKYKIDEYQSLLDELEKVKKQIDEVRGGAISLADVEKEIDKYLDEIDYYSCVLNDCRYRNAAEAVNTFDCKKNN